MLLAGKSRPRKSDSSILHRCGPDTECFCMYDAECTGEFDQIAITLPVWLSALLSPLHTLRVLDAKRRLR